MKGSHIFGMHSSTFLWLFGVFLAGCRCTQQWWKWTFSHGAAFCLTCIPFFCTPTQLLWKKELVVDFMPYYCLLSNEECWRQLAIKVFLIAKTSLTLKMSTTTGHLCYMFKVKPSFLSKTKILQSFKSNTNVNDRSMWWTAKITEWFLTIIYFVVSL